MGMAMAATVITSEQSTVTQMIASVMPEKPKPKIVVGSMSAGVSFEG